MPHLSTNFKYKYWLISNLLISLLPKLEFNSKSVNRYNYIHSKIMFEGMFMGISN